MIESKLATMRASYNAENNLIPGAPMVTWSDMMLVECIDFLADRLWKLEQRVIELETKE